MRRCVGAALAQASPHLLELCFSPRCHYRISLCGTLSRLALHELLPLLENARAQLAERVLQIVPATNCLRLSCERLALTRMPRSANAAHRCAETNWAANAPLRRLQVAGGLKNRLLSLRDLSRVCKF